MVIRLFNSLTRKKEVFRPRPPVGEAGKKTVTFYTCGPTVYDHAHIGNLRTFIFEDILKRMLVRAGYKVRHVMNITDVDDKTIYGAKKSHTTLSVFTRKYEKAFKDDLKKLNILPPSRFVRATDHINDMISVIKALLKTKSAYVRDGSVYFDISSFPRYGNLARIINVVSDKAKREVFCKSWDLHQLDPMGRGQSRLRDWGVKICKKPLTEHSSSDLFTDNDEYTKDEARDFALWKARKGNEPFWPSPFGKGRPGWHIECSTMAVKYLGQPIDIHAGGVDLLFPHHENEIAQAESATKKQFVRYWLHGEHLFVAGQKMSKSLKNIFTLRDVEAEKTSPIAFRYFVLGAHYRSPLNFTWEGLSASQEVLDRLYDFVRKLLEMRSKKSQTRIRKPDNQILFAFQKQFDTAITDDVNTPKALAVLWELVREYNKNPTAFNEKEILQMFFSWDEVLGLNLRAQKMVQIPPSVKAFLTKREEARQNRDFVTADQLRKKINKQGWEINDTPDGPQLKKAYR